MKGSAMVTRWLVLAVCVLVIIVGCGGDSDDNGNTDTPDPPPTEQDSSAPANTPDNSADEPADDGDDEPAESSGAVEFTTVRGARAGSTADVVVKAPARTECSITYIAPDGTVGEMRGLEPKTTSGTGRVTWGWKIDTDTPSGDGTVSVTCGGETAETTITIP